jgi:TPP-dependent trihydroxycyclohexane-1,2-dione (THcHDO) dehydratase
MRTLTDPVETGAVTIALPQDVQAEAFDWPVELFAERTWHIARPPAEAGDVAVAEDAEAAGEEAVALPVALDLLRGQEADQGLSDGDPGHAATS